MPPDAAAPSQSAASATGVARQLLQTPGTMTSKNNFCVLQGNLALLRADWEIVDDTGSIIVSGSSAELVRRQPDGRWLNVIDHAAGAGLPRVR